MMRVTGHDLCRPAQKLFDAFGLIGHQLFFERAPLSFRQSAGRADLIDDEPVAAVGGHPAGAGVRLDQGAKPFQPGHLVAHRRRPTAPARVGDGGVAEDLTQETFLRAWRARSGYRGEAASARGWLCAIAANVARDHMRARRRRPVEEEAVYSDIPSVTEDPASSAEAAETLEQLRAALERLPAGHRE